MEKKTALVKGNGNQKIIVQMDKLIRKNIREEKRQYRLEQLEEATEQGNKWTEIKRMKAKYVPKYCKFKDAHGNRIPENQYAEKAAEYLAEKQWKKNQALPEKKMQSHHS